jgi:hypothetical protein
MQILFNYTYKEIGNGQKGIRKKNVPTRTIAPLYSCISRLRFFRSELDDTVEKARKEILVEKWFPCDTA